MIEILNKIQALLKTVQDKHDTQLHLDGVLSASQAAVEKRSTDLDKKAEELSAREAAVSPYEELKTGQKKLAEDQKKLSDDRNALDEAIRSHEAVSRIQNQDIEQEKTKIAAEFVAIKKTKDGMEDEIVARVKALLEKMDKEKSGK